MKIEFPAKDMVRLTSESGSDGFDLGVTFSILQTKDIEAQVGACCDDGRVSMEFPIEHIGIHAEIHGGNGE
jgi:hypothetical protein